MTPADRARLARILARGRELEGSWPVVDRNASRTLHLDSAYRELRREVEACRDADAPELRRLQSLGAHLHEQISLAHLYACLVPFERIAGRTVRDDEFLIEEGDQHVDIERVPLKIIVENLRSAFNVGALFRTADGLGASELIVCGYTPGPDEVKTARTAMGTAGYVSWRRVDRARTACLELREEGYQIVALETAATAKSLYEYDFAARPTAFVLGNERFGLEGQTLEVVDAICRIPLRGVKNSMNVGVAFGIAAFEWSRQFELANAPK